MIVNGRRIYNFTSDRYNRVDVVWGDGFWANIGYWRAQTRKAQRMTVRQWNIRYPKQTIKT